MLSRVDPLVIARASSIAAGTFPSGVSQLEPVLSPRRAIGACYCIFALVRDPFGSPPCGRLCSAGADGFSKRFPSTQGFTVFLRASLGSPLRPLSSRASGAGGDG